mmetsp:Transcript_59704/g.172304  ORF Transcript_59704/g.172304 Transcript_59704/m.172304 type:complete len:265 (-) Transcript_59704:275-1069(-)
MSTGSTSARPTTTSSAHLRFVAKGASPAASNGGSAPAHGSETAPSLSTAGGLRAESGTGDAAAVPARGHDGRAAVCGSAARLPRCADRADGVGPVAAQASSRALKPSTSTLTSRRTKCKALDLAASDVFAVSMLRQPSPTRALRHSRKSLRIHPLKSSKPFSWEKASHGSHSSEMAYDIESAAFAITCSQWASRLPSPSLRHTRKTALVAISWMPSHTSLKINCICQRCVPFSSPIASNTSSPRANSSVQAASAPPPASASPNH